ncbi:MAG: hypothetical protein SFV32_04025 [Opitutaceae bacterium]|nr:hypothetical protein [Opitutaceae bacterium]
MQRLHHFLVLVAWLVASGSHWDLVQTFAWGKMIAAYSEDLPLVEAVQETFNPQNLCSMCKVVRDAKEQESGMTQAGAKPDGKWLLVLPRPQPTGIQPPVSTGIPSAVEAMRPQWTPEPSLRPPRVA